MFPKESYVWQMCIRLSLAATSPKYTHDGLIAFEEGGDAIGLPTLDLSSLPCNNKKAPDLQLRLNMVAFEEGGDANGLPDPTLGHYLVIVKKPQLFS